MTGPEAERLGALLACAGGHAPAGARAVTALVDLIASDRARAPTTIVDPADVLELHVADALDGLAVAPLRAARSVVDLGSGAGFPGLVLAAVLPCARVSVLDSAARKCAFLRRAVAAMELPNADVIHARVEDWASATPRPDVVTARAVASLSTLVEYAAPLLDDGGHLIAWKGRRDPIEEADGAAAALATGLELVELRAIAPRPQAAEHHLHVFAKVAATPSRFPRRPGMAGKRPIVARG